MPPLPARPALFIDIDGTLLPIAERPDEVRPDATLLRQLGELQTALDGALAILSGRTLASLDALLTPLVLPAAGVHGLERRRADGTLVRSLLDSRTLDIARVELGRFVRSNPRLHLEDKGLALAVHYRDAPELFSALTATMVKLLSQLDQRYHIQPGLAVLELKPLGYDKGLALKEFMSEPEFYNRQPVAIGDDITDLDAFRAAEEVGGMTIAVGNRISGQWQLTDPPALRRWLMRLA
jgi:trehalose 6-phosphate phosphatase